MSTNVKQSMNKLHFPHLKGAVNRDQQMYAVAGGIMKYFDPEQAITNGYRRHVIHELQPRRDPPSDFFSGTNNFIDVELPQDLHYVDKMDLHIELRNNHATETLAFTNFVSNLISRIEVRVGAEIKETITDIESWISQVPYESPWELDRHASNQYKASGGLGVDTSNRTAATDFPKDIRIPLRNVISQCKIPTAAIDDQVTFRFYSQNAANCVGATGSLTLNNLRLHLREKRSLDVQLAGQATGNLDWRYLQPKLEEKSVTFAASGNTTKVVLNNFTEDDFCSHLWVLIRSSSHNDAAQDDYLKDVVSKLYLEDEAGQNITNGVQWTSDQLLDQLYADKFENTAGGVGTDSKGLYIPLCPSENPAADYKKGGQHGSQPLSRNMRLCIVPTGTGGGNTYFVSVVAMCHRHVRTENGQLTIV